jgi:hypothetical protein
MPFWSNMGKSVTRAVLGGAAGRAAAPFARAMAPVVEKGGQALGYAIRRPVLAAGVLGGGLGLAYAHSEFSTPSFPASGLASNAWADEAARRGLPSTGFEWGTGSDRWTTSRDFMASTEGLVQGLHAGRHK